MKMKQAWIRKDMDSVSFDCGLNLLDWLKRKHPAQKDAMETNARYQRLGWLAGREAAPRARKMVLPVCILAKVPDALKATLSQRPETIHVARTGMSVWARWTSSRRVDSHVRFSGWLETGRVSWDVRDEPNTVEVSGGAAIIVDQAWKKFLSGFQITAGDQDKKT
jgi:hypothetical protein